MIIDATLKHNKREKQGHLHKVWVVGNNVGGRPKGLKLLQITNHQVVKFDRKINTNVTNFQLIFN
jgi:hypothetical protein